MEKVCNEKCDGKSVIECVCWKVCEEMLDGNVLEGGVGNWCGNEKKWNVGEGERRKSCVHEESLLWNGRVECANGCCCGNAVVCAVCEPVLWKMCADVCVNWGRKWMVCGGPVKKNQCVHENDVCGVLKTMCEWRGE